MRLIDADRLKDKLVSLRDYRQVCEIINNAPTVEYPFYQEAYQSGYEEGRKDSERPQGKWIWDSDFIAFGNPYGAYRCSYCDGHSSDKYPYCFWCGADMRTEVKE